LLSRVAAVVVAVSREAVALVDSARELVFP
jgi:hypothetical protein